MNQMSIAYIYQENLKLGYQINELNDQNNFYRISINNIKKITQNFNGNRLQPQPRISQSASQHLVQPTHSQNMALYNNISNKIQLKNLQIKVGTHKRKVDKMQKVFEGSISSLTGKSERIEMGLNRAIRQYELYYIQNEIIDQQFMADIYLSLIDLASKSAQKKDFSKFPSFKLLKKKTTKHNIDNFQDQEIKLQNKLEQIAKEEKQLKKQKLILVQKIKKLEAVRFDLKQKVYGGKINIRELQAQQTGELQILSAKQTQLQNQIAKQDELLEHQYKMNQQLKQRILDRNQQQNKQIKVLQQQIKKCGQQVRDIKLKYQQLQNKYKKASKDI